MTPVRSLRPESVTPQFIFGLFIMLVGVALTLDQLRIVDAGRVLAIWPAAIIAFGVVLWRRRADSRGRFWGFIWIFVGSWLLLSTLGLIRVGFWALFWPVLLIAIGAGLVTKTLQQTGSLPTEPARARHLFAVMSETKRRVDTVFEGAYMTAFMGNCTLDLRHATIEPGTQQAIDVFGIFSDHKILAPAGWDIVVDVMPIAGGVEDKRERPVVEPPPVPGVMPPRIVVRGVIVFSNLKVKES